MGREREKGVDVCLDKDNPEADQDNPGGRIKTIQGGRTKTTRGGGSKQPREVGVTREVQQVAKEPTLQ